MFNKILIANRGEIAVRIIRTCKTMGIETVAIYSEPDFRSLHVIHADEAVLLGGARPADSYLNMEKIIDAAKKTGCQAIHPGYGFLSENAEFSDKVAAAGLAFIGPPGKVIASMGDKIAAKKLAISAGVPTVPGVSEPIVDLQDAISVANQVGYPVLLKPAGGGGGKGMRIVEKEDEMASALQLCQQETKKSFGDARIFVEKYIRRPRHIEIQIFADTHGNVVHLGERECSIQRRYQKIIEESPSCAIDPQLREKMGALSCELARKVGYVNAGTIEYILDEDGSFYFLEMNTRLQVEHPVTELVNGLDLVELQLRVAAGQALPFNQEKVALSGWAIEVRICAEDPKRGFAPSVGLITRYAVTRGQHVRIDSGVDAGSTVSVYYDPMLAKVITWGVNREEARKNMVQALNGYHLEGIHTNIDFANQVLTHPEFIKGNLTTAFIPTYLLDPKNQTPPPTETLHFMATATVLIYHLRENLMQSSLTPLKAKVGRATVHKKYYEYVARYGNEVYSIRLENCGSMLEWRVEVNDTVYQVKTPRMEFFRRRLKLNINGEDAHFRVTYNGNINAVAYCGISATFEIYNPREWELAHFMPPPPEKGSGNILDCPMPGLVVAVKASVGERVFRGQELIILESMKMESAVAAPRDAVIESVNVKPGDAVETGSILIKFKEEAES